MVVFTVETGFSRRVRFAGCASTPSRSWLMQQARQIAWALPLRSDPTRFLIRDRDNKLLRRGVFGVMGSESFAHLSFAKT
jgi:hypothetical protein